MENKLSAKHRVAALLEARGELNISEIAKAINLSYPALNRVRAFPEYRLLRDTYYKEMADRTLDAAAELLAQFNDEAPHAFDTLQELHGRADRDSVRLGAAKEILDRASISPKKQEFRLGGGESGITIQLGSQKMGMIIGALEDIEDHETIDLLDAPEPKEITESIGEIVAKEAP